MAQGNVTTEMSIDELERQRQKLQENMDKLRKSIKIWQLWEVEYEGLREELQSLGNDVSSGTIEEAGSQCAGELLNQKEINLLIRDERKQPRTCQQIIGLLSRRIEYVQSNIKSLQGSLQAAEDKMTAPQALSPVQQNDEEGYPLMEIQEELDEDGNIMSSSVTPASEAAPQVIEALRKAGVLGLQPKKEDGVPGCTSESEPDQTQAPKDADVAPSALKQVNPSPSISAPDQQQSPSTSESDTKGDSRKTGRRRKSVTFADGTKQAPPTPTQPRPAKDVQAAKAASAARRVKAEVRGSIDALKKVHNAGFINEEVFDRFRRGYVERLHNLPATLSKHSIAQRQPSNNQQSISTRKTSTNEDFDPAVPSNESLEDAALRQEMIRYNMNEVGAVVAEMNLDEEDQSQTSSPEYSNEDNELRHSSDEDENDWGISTSSALTSDYIKEMQALDQKLAASSRQTANSNATVEALLQAEDELVVGEDGNPVKKDPAKTTTDQEKKAVRFARDLDIQERPPSPKPNGQNQPRARKASAPVHADIVERRNQTNSSPNPTGPTPKKKVSQFKMSRSAEHQAAMSPKKASHLQIKADNANQVKMPSLPAFTPPATPKMTPTGPAGRTHAANVVERPLSDKVSREDVSEPDELDASLLRQELTMDYHRTRNRMIQRQGGFLANEEEEEAEGPMVDENGKKISRFKAARLKGPEG
ncbi:MAG: hypothetical protein Q9225_002010 [Loekoesia sp. 1 TL-2023]